MVADKEKMEERQLRHSVVFGKETFNAFATCRLR